MPATRPSTAASSSASPSLAASRQGSSSPLASQQHDSDDDDGNGVQMILRIKRKRNQDPVDALIIQQNERRSKRRSIVLPNDGADEQGGSSQGAASDATNAASKQRGVFRLAETVSLGSFSDPVAARKLHQRISALSRASPAGPSTKPLQPSKLAQSVSSPSLQGLRPLDASTKDTDQTRAHRSLGNSVSSLSASTEGLSSATPASRIKALASEQIDRDKDRRSRSGTPVGIRFKVIAKEHAGGKGLRRSGSSASLRKMRSTAEPNRPWHTPAGPPVIRSKKEKEAEAIFGRIIDAETESSNAAQASSSRAKAEKQKAPTQEDHEMAGLDAKFAEMLGDYLRSNNIEPSQDIDQIAQGASAAGVSEEDVVAGHEDQVAEEDDDEDDYVYDVYYRDMLPTKAGPQGSAETGLEPAQVAGRGKGSSAAAVPDSMALPRVLGGEVVPPESATHTPNWFPGLDVAGPNAVVASLEGFEDSNDELEQADEEGFESFDEGEDEDSNDEGFYRNDYPEQELPEADEVDFDYDDDDVDEDEHDSYSLSDGSF
ncbi:Transcription factor Iwr1 [Kalmanozyma brasiliensis GHG001]|uniref:Transcription factor Iwr1 domain-containing protein n=1 Tax=Kalmanozyma brasiliensis (strain GHG001) TaxID=1365824 RepID=V5EB45_KALBG|nr:Transcription factor Iwr1 [Kalmanozyma brasiliensis GHG001]EST07606.1 Transcription factor Iwr1 [Kalmanozyma brasiliensis GHG001]